MHSLNVRALQMSHLLVAATPSAEASFVPIASCIFGTIFPEFKEKDDQFMFYGQILREGRPGMLKYWHIKLVVSGL